MAPARVPIMTLQMISPGYPSATVRYFSYLLGILHILHHAARLSVSGIANCSY
jgi:hypothetical protein